MSVTRTARHVRKVSDLITTVANTLPCPFHGYGARCSTHGANGHDYAVDIAMSNVRFGSGVTAEVRFDAEAHGAKNILVFTDKSIAKLKPLKTTLDALTRARIPYHVFDDVSVEPTDESFRRAIAVAKHISPDLFIAVGGGSVIDTAKAANLYYSHPEADFKTFINAPIGEGKHPTLPLKPLFAIPTTAGTGRLVM
jgi:hydroxyacid-oxoacid transhydrogenase